MKSSSLCALTYLGLFILSAAYAVFFLAHDTANSALIGVPAIVVTLPWSMFFVPIVNMTGYVRWYSQFSSEPYISGIFAMTGLAPGALINTYIFYRLGKIFE